MKKKILTGVLSVLLYFTVAFGMVSVTYAWLCNGKTVDLNVKGTAIANYFHSGSGTAEDPYILMTPRHVYNLAWLQYLGMFNETNSSGALTSQTYFKLGDNINMADGAGEGYQTIPPIGTSEYPFLGNFDGNGKTISNAIVANQIGQDGLLAHPPVVEDVLYSEIIGFFGIVGDYTGAVTLTDDQLRALEVKNLNLESVTIKTSTQKSLAGLFAGYVNGNISNINVVSGSITAKQNVLPYTETLNGDTDNPLVINNTLAMSKYALIGDYHTTKIHWVGAPGSVSTNQGQNNGWGGSIDMLSLAKRLNYMMTAGSEKKSNGYLSTSQIQTTYHTVGYSGDTSYKYSYNVDDQMIFLLDGTYMPLNINTDNITQSNYSAFTAETILSTNTGYIVGKNSQNDAAVKSGLMTVRNRKIGQVCSSLQGKTDNWQNIGSSIAYNDSALQILTKDVNGNYYVIGDSHNGLTDASKVYSCYKTGNKQASLKSYSDLNLTQYEGTNNVRGKLSALLAEPILNVLQIDKPTPTTNMVLSLDNSVNLGSNSVDSLVKGTVHFATATAGVVTMVAATIPSQAAYVTTYNYQYLPQLYQVERNSSGVITSLNPINTICTNGNGEFKYNTSAGNGWEEIYNYENMALLTTNNADGKQFMYSLFYFEIPVGSGEYVLGGNGSNQTFLVYLDIGANAGDEQEDDGNGGDGTGGVKPEDAAGTITGIAFAYKNGSNYVQIVTTHTVNNETVAVAVTYVFTLKNTAATTHSGATAGFTATNASTVTVQNSNTGQFSVTENPATSGSG